MKSKKIIAVIMAVMLMASCALLSACGSSGGGNSGSGSETENSESSESSENSENSSESAQNGETAENDSGNSSEQKYNTETAAVTGKVYVLSGMSSEDEDFDEQLIKDMFDIDDIAKYMSIYFEKGGTAYVDSLLYGKKVQKGKWGEAKDGTTILEVQDDLYEIEQDEEGTISTTSVEEDGEGFLLTFKEPKNPPKSLKKYVK